MKLAIVGAGVAGLAAAHALRQRRPDLDVTIYERSREPGGRVATGRRDGYAFDHGAQYMKAPTPELERLLTAELPAADLLDIGRPVWTFDGGGMIAEGDPAQNADPKWTYRGGLDRLGALLAAGLEVRYATPIGRVDHRPPTTPSTGLRAGDHRPPTTDHRPPTTDHRRPRRACPTDSQFSILNSQFMLFDAAGGEVGAAGMVLFTAPAPETAEILAAGNLVPGIKEVLGAELARVRYRRCISLALAYAGRVERPYYALVNIDRGHPIAWLAFEHDKGPQRCPAGHSLLIAQMAPQFSHDHWGAPAEDLTRIVAEQVSELLGAELRRPLWGDARRWRYALPDGVAPFDALNGAGAASGLFFAGDYTMEPGRVHLAIESGWRAAKLIDAALSW